MSSENIIKRVQIRLGARRGERGKIINYNVDGFKNYTVVLDTSGFVVQVSPWELETRNSLRLGIMPQNQALAQRAE